MHLSFKKNDTIAVYCRKGLRLISFKFQVLRIEQIVNGYKIIGTRFTSDNKKEDDYQLFLYHNGNACVCASYIGNPIECYLDKQLAISVVEKNVTKRV